MNERVLYNAQKSVIEEVKQELLKKQKQKDREMLSKKYAEPWLENINLMIWKPDETDISN